MSKEIKDLIDSVDSANRVHSDLENKIKSLKEEIQRHETSIASHIPTIIQPYTFTIFNSRPSLITCVYNWYKFIKTTGISGFVGRWMPWEQNTRGCPDCKFGILIATPQCIHITCLMQPHKKTRKPTNWWSSAKRNVTHPTATASTILGIACSETVHA